MVLGAQPGQGVQHAVPEQVLTAQLGRMVKGPALGTGTQGHGASRTSRTRRLPHRQKSKQPLQGLLKLLCKDQFLHPDRVQDRIRI